MTELPIRRWYNGQSYTVFVLDRPPAAAIIMTVKDIYLGRKFFYMVEIGPDKGKWYWDIITPDDLPAVRQKVLANLALTN